MSQTLISGTIDFTYGEQRWRVPAEVTTTRAAVRLGKGGPLLIAREWVDGRPVELRQTHHPLLRGATVYMAWLAA